MDIFRKALRKAVHFLGEKRLISPWRTMFLLHTIELCRTPRFNPPVDINEKLMWLEHNTDTQIWSRLADKYAVRKYVADKGFPEALIPLIGLYESADSINFDYLPQRFVIKSTHATSQTLIVEDKSKIRTERVYKTIRSWLGKPFGLCTGEIHYMKITPRVIIEELLSEDNGGGLPVDYKFYCFDGKVDGCLVVSNRNIKAGKYKINMLDVKNWEEIHDAILPEYRNEEFNLKRPDNLPKMVKMAEILSQGFCFVRIDLYNVNGKIYFGEMTFTPAGCRKSYMSRPMLQRLGEKITL